MAKKMKCKLSISGIRDLQKEIQSYQSSLEYKARLLAERLSEIGVERARVHVAELDAIFTSELIQSIHNEYKSSKKGGAIFVIKADSDHAVYVEMGTGIVGAESPYPGKFPAVYAQGKTIQKLSDGRYGWFYKGKDGNVYFTEGMPSRPFMYETSLDLLNQIETITKQIFKR